MSAAASAVEKGADAYRLEHCGLLYRNPEQYLAATTGFIHTALAAESPVLVAVPGAHVDLIRDGLGQDARQVTFVDMAIAGRNPTGIIPNVLLSFAASYPDRRVSIVGEPVWPGRSSAEYPSCASHEALINVAFAGWDAAIVCPYDAHGLPERAIVDAHRTHPYLVDEHGTRWASSAYLDPVQATAMFNEPLPEPPAAVPSLGFRQPTELAEVRRFVTAHAGAAGLADARVDQLAVAINELATNTIEHTAGPGTVRVWVEDSSVVCQVDDGGYLPDPLAGRLPPPPDQLGGRGLLLVNRLCDLVRVHTVPGATSIRLYLNLPAGLR